eukprot:172772-Rhodomonas_salina.20
MPERGDSLPSAAKKALAKSRIEAILTELHMTDTETINVLQPLVKQATRNKKTRADALKHAKKLKRKGVVCKAAPKAKKPRNASVAAELVSADEAGPAARVP